MSEEQGSLRKRAPREASRDAETSSTVSQEAVKWFAKRLNQLFESALTDSGRPYTLTEVAQATGLSVSHLSILRSGKITSVPSFDRVEALARFFNVNIDFFSKHPRTSEIDEEMRRTLSKPLVRDVALRAGSMGMPERALVLQMMEQADLLLARMRQAAGTEHTETG
ncbi:MAG TPA: XRE family transcriptional regulator [Chloroflexota bacterium]|nr:XRE family transcriptional regulator [Chloroflexota bacterium]